MPPYTASTGAQFWTSETDFFHIISYFGPKQSMFFDVTAQDFTAILKKKMTTTIPKNDFFFLQMCNEIRFLNACCVFWALRIHPNHWQKKNWIHKTTKMKYRPHFWPNSTKTGKIWENWAGSRLFMGCDEFCDSKTRKRLLVPNIIDRGREEIWPFFHQFWPPVGYL